jgi:hypothetical protein
VEEINGCTHDQEQELVKLADGETASVDSCNAELVRALNQEGGFKTAISGSNYVVFHPQVSSQEVKTFLKRACPNIYNYSMFCTILFEGIQNPNQRNAHLMFPKPTTTQRTLQIIMCNEESANGESEEIPAVESLDEKELDHDNF